MKQRLLILLAVLSISFGSAGALRGQGVWTTDTATGSNLGEGSQSCVLNGTIYVADGGSSSGLIDVFDPIAHVWSTLVPHDSRFRTVWSANVIKDKIYLILDSTEPLLLNQVVVYDPLTNKLTVINTKGGFTSRELVTTAVVDNKLYVIGGDTGNFVPCNILDVFDPASSTWSTPITKGKFTARTGLASSVVDGKVYVMGGDTGHAYGGCNILEVFDPSNNTWSTPITTGTFSERRYLTSTALNGKIYVMGGDSGGNITPVSTIEVFDPSTSHWSTPTTIGQMTRRFYLTSCALNGKIYAMGGYRPHGSLNINEVFTPTPQLVESESSKNSIELSPNPTSGIITVRNAPQRIASVTALNVLGQSVFEDRNPHGSDFTLDLSRMSSGTYFLKLVSADGIVIQKIVKR
jgi:N-acetylneuraminic acid mutarotase